jgi:hypothetical protein
VPHAKAAHASVLSSVRGMLQQWHAAARPHARPPSTRVAMRVQAAYSGKENNLWSVSATAALLSIR